MSSFHFLCLDFLFCLSEIIRCEGTLLLCLPYNLWLHCSAAFPSQGPACPESSLPFQTQQAFSATLFSCSHYPNILYSLLPQAPICQMLKAPWEFQQCTRLHTGSPGVISELTVLCSLTHTQRDLGSLGSLLSLQGISQQATKRKGQWHSI